MRRLIDMLTVVLLALCCACTAAEEPAVAQEIVVEGWIDHGGFPMVTLTRSIPISNEYQPVDDLSKYMERWARVAISDGEREVVMIGKYTRDNFPPYIYTTSDMRGEAGKTYRLTVDCADGTHAEAVTTIPEPVDIDSIRQEYVSGRDTLRQLYAFITDPHEDMRYYKVFVHVMGQDKGYMSAYLGITNSSLLADDGKIAVNQGRINLRNDFSPYFVVGDTVAVKLARIDETAYNFWRGFEDITALSRNPLFPATDNMPSNVTGALGYWFGYGSCVRQVVVGGSVLSLTE